MKISTLIVRLLTPLIWLIFPFRSRGKAALCAEVGDRPFILCCNHTSFIDPVLVLATFPRHVFFMAKDELFHGAFTRWFLGKVMGAFPVKRGSGDTGALTRAEKTIKKGRILGIFPEGTRSKTGELGRIHSGAALIAARTKALVVPVVLFSRRKKAAPFCMTTVYYGKPLTTEELHLSDESEPDLRYASRLLGDKMKSMLEECR